MVAVGTVLLGIGAWFLVAGYSFVDAWSQYASLLQTPNPGTPACLCPLRVVQFVLPPSPEVVILSYALMAPVALVLGWWILLRAKAMPPTGRSDHRLVVASLLLFVGMGSILLYLTLGLVMDAAGWYAPWPLIYPFLGMLLAVPVVVLLAGILALLGSARYDATVQSQASRK